jgi:hypothetical protein
MPATSHALSLPVASKGRPTPAVKAAYEKAVEAWCAAIVELGSRLDFKVSTRGWCYLLEPHGLAKGDFDKAERLITACRKSGKLPLDICAEDASREFDGLEQLDAADVQREAASWIDVVQRAHRTYAPISFWTDQPYYLLLLVEKIDLKSLFADICDRFHIPRANAKGWTDINCRAEMMRQFKAAEQCGQIPVLLYCGDLDPAGLQITDCLRKNMEDLADVVGWDPQHLVIDRFGLNADFITRHGLTWIDGLGTGSGMDLTDSEHPHNDKAYVQDYLALYGPRKCEANALVANPDAGRQLMRDAIAKYLPEDAPERYEQSMAPYREPLRLEIIRRWRL